MKLRIQGARENNLQNTNVNFSAGLTVVTGVSGSGKSSLVFDTIYHEAQRRFQDMILLGNRRERLSPAAVDQISGLLPAVAVGQNLLNRNPNSTVATASGLHPFLRLLFARFGTRHCPKCGAPIEFIDQDSLIAKLQGMQQPCWLGAPLIRNAIGSHRTLLSLLIKTFGIDRLQVDGNPYHGAGLSPGDSHSILINMADLDGGESAADLRSYLETSFALGCTTIRIEREGSVHLYSLAPACAQCGAWLPPLDPQQFNQTCPVCSGQGCTECQGTGMHPLAAAALWEGKRFDQILAASIKQTLESFDRESLPPSADRLASEINTRLSALTKVGMGYITLNRPVPTLSRGEAQRLRLAVLLTGRLSDLLHLLDEPTIGQHPQDVEKLMGALAELSGPVIFVEHDRVAAAHAQAAVDLGPGAGKEGGKILFAGPTAELWKADTLTGRFFSGLERLIIPEKRPQPERFMTVTGAHQHNLRNVNIPLAIERLNVICGVSGSGKSTLVEDVLFASLAAGEPVGCEGVKGLTTRAVIVDQSPIGRNPRSNPATYTKLLDIIRDCFAVNTGLDPTNFSFNTNQGACQGCHGVGAVEVKMRYLPSTWIICSECDGQRFSEEVLSATVTFGDQIARSIADVFSMSVVDALPLLSHAPGLSNAARENANSILLAMQDIGLGYLTLGQPSPTLSGGEAQRVKLAKYLGKRNLSKQVLILDEPSSGLHPADIHGLLVVLDRLVQAGATIVVVEHNLDIIRAADWLIELGPGAGEAGGQLLYAGLPEDLIHDTHTPTSQALAREDQLDLDSLKPQSEKNIPEAISIRGARANNLNNIDIDIPKNALTVVTGLSGSGKSSLVGNVIECEARRRYLESLAMYERQSIHERGEADVDSVHGLGVTLAIDSRRASFNQRTHLGDDTEIIQGLAVLFARKGTLSCPSCGSIMRRDRETFTCPTCEKTLPLPKPRHFLPVTYAAACQTCHGVGSLQEPRPEKLIIHPEKPLCGGAMYSPGFFPKGYLCKPFNGGYDMLQAFAARHGFDPATTPWDQISPEAQRGFLFGDPEPIMVTYTNRHGAVTQRLEVFPGYYGWIRDWDVGGTYTETVPCPACQGAGLREPYRSICLEGMTIFELRQMPLEQLKTFIGDLPMTLSQDPIAGHLFDKLRQKDDFLCAIGLGYLHLDRFSATLSAGEAQRVKLAGLLGGELTGLTLLLDEPTRGLHPAEVDALIQALETLKHNLNTIIVVEHDLQVIRSADFIIDLGPSAGRFGGQVVAQGTPDQIAETITHTGRWLRGTAQVYLPEGRKRPERWLKLFQPSGNNLKIDCFELPLGVMTGVCGLSGSGKSTLIHDTLGRILAPSKQTTSVAYEPIAPLPHHGLEGAPVNTIVVSQSRAGLNSPASFLGVEAALRAVFAQGESAISLGLDENDLKKGCTACKGRGASRVDMGFLPDIFETCEVCSGSGYPPEVNQVRFRDRTLPEVMEQSIQEVHERFSDIKTISAPLQSALKVGLGYLILNQPGRTLSGGEAQRLKIAERLEKQTQPDTLYLLDEPTIGQHLEDIKQLITVLRSLVEDGCSVLVVEHHPHVLAACDWLVELGPGGGPHGGHIIAAGTPQSIAGMNTPTAPYLAQTLRGAA